MSFKYIMDKSAKEAAKLLDKAAKVIIQKYATYKKLSYFLYELWI